MALFGVTVAIVGTAGRNEDAARLTAPVFSAMCSAVPAILASLGLERGRVVLVSGGAGICLSVIARHDFVV